MFRLIELNDSKAIPGSMWVNSNHVVTVDFNHSVMTLSDGQRIVFSKNSYETVKELMKYTNNV